MYLEVTNCFKRLAATGTVRSGAALINLSDRDYDYYFPKLPCPSQMPPRFKTITVSTASHSFKAWRAFTCTVKAINGYLDYSYYNILMWENHYFSGKQMVVICQSRDFPTYSRYVVIAFIIYIIILFHCFLLQESYFTFQI